MEFFRRWGIARAVREAGFPDDFRMSRVVCTDVSKSPLDVDAQAALRDMPVPAYSCEKSSAVRSTCCSLSCSGRLRSTRA
jgi:hypothetical protein